MPVIKKSSEVLFSPAQMYQLVADVETYPDFLPWCVDSTVESATEDEVRAKLVLAQGGIQKSFTTCNRLQKDKMIELRLLDGPFHHLEGFWRFEPIDNGGCRVSLDMEFEFAGKLLSLAVGPVFSQMANSLVDAFCERAEDVYGTAKA